MSETVQITQEELKFLKERVAELDRKIKELSTPSSFEYGVKKKPFTLPRNIEEGTPIFGFTESSVNDPWNLFCAIAKSIHDETPIFYMSTTHPGSKKPYIRYTGEKKCKKVRELSLEQYNMSVSMLDEMIEIYNRYMVQIHTTVSYIPYEGADPIICPVLVPEMSNKN